MLLAAGASAVVPYLAEDFAEHEEGGWIREGAQAMYEDCAKCWREWEFPRGELPQRHLFEVLASMKTFAATTLKMRIYPGTKTLELLLQDYLKDACAAFGGESDDLRIHGLYRYRIGAELHANSPEFLPHARGM